MKEKVVSFRKTPQSLTLLCAVFLAAAVFATVYLAAAHFSA